MPKGRHIVYIGLGSNIDPETNLLRALKELRQRTRVLATSSTWRSPAVEAEGPD
ncbi:MAG: 2-amino-4-hydroxy-6-hydroxymethyldihydropteridine diphosphokinase, partial [Anaerolineales bacterium]